MMKIASFFSFILCLTYNSQSYEILLDDGNGDMTTVTGYYEPNGMTYHQRLDIPMSQGENLAPGTVRLHVHVGSGIVSYPEGDEVKIAIRVNGHPWHWRSLKPYMNNENHWIEFDIPQDEWRPGRNKIETNSNVLNKGNMISESLDMLGSSTPPIAGYSYHTHDFKNYIPLSDRNWGIRVKPDIESGSKPVSITIAMEEKESLVGELAQFYLKAQDSHGNPVCIIEPVKWETQGGHVNRYGGFQPRVTGKTMISATVGDLTSIRELLVKAKIPPGIDPPIAPARLASCVPEGHINLNGKWDFRLDPENKGEKDNWFQPDKSINWGEITVPGCWQAQGWGLRYHGVGWYRYEIEVPEKWKDKNLRIRFDGACTYTKIWLNGKYIGEHIGNWTPFEFQITDSIKQGKKNVLIVRVEERPRHFSAGFPRELGNFAGCDTHFGGLWQDVSLYSTGNLHIDDVFVLPQLNGNKVDVTVSLSGNVNPKNSVSCKIYKPDGSLLEQREEILSPEEDKNPFCVKFSIPVINPVLWGPENPALYKALIQVKNGQQISHQEIIRFGMRDVVTNGSQLLLNGEPVYIRGMLHWGYYPDLFSITPSEDQIRREFEDLRSCGFNLVKVCLFVFPKRFYEIADETGMLIWQEYPTWQTIPKPGEHGMRETMKREYSEWFRFDRNHPSVILRSLTCEAQNYDEKFISDLYDLGKEMTGGSVIADNSGFLNHTKTDWYDMHSYRELNDHYGTMDWIAKTVSEKPEIKPYLTGEDMDFDTYRDLESIRNAFIDGKEIPWWLANDNFRDQERFEERIKKMINPEAPGVMVRMQKRRGLSVRKALFEEYRRHKEFSGYVMTSIRDNPFTRPGFYDDLMKPKWIPGEWTRFNRDRVLILYPFAGSPEKRRHSFSFRTDESIQLRMFLSNYAAGFEDEDLRWQLVDADNKILANGSMKVEAKRGELKVIKDIPLALSQNIIDTSVPLKCRFKAEIGEKGCVTKNDWPVWLFPSREKAAVGKETTFYFYSPQGSDAYAKEFPALKGQSVSPVSGGEKWKIIQSGNILSFTPGTREVLIVDRLDYPVKTALRKGACVLYIPREKSERDIPRYDNELFWRESVIWLPRNHPLMGDFPQEGFVDLQFLDMTQKSPFNTEQFRNDIQPLIWGINPRVAGTRFRDYIFECAAGRGKILACSLNVYGETNVAGEYFLRCLIQYASSGDFHPKRDSEEYLLEKFLGIND